MTITEIHFLTKDRLWGCSLGLRKTWKGSSLAGVDVADPVFSGSDEKGATAGEEMVSVDIAYDGDVEYQPDRTENKVR
jgi:hypothetical protein